MNLSLHENQDREDSPIAATIAPEDLRQGEFVAVLSEIIEVPSFLWTESLSGGQEPLVRVRKIPTDERVPLKIKAICLPFVFAKTPSGQHRTLDVRLVHLARLERNYAKRVWKVLKVTSPALSLLMT